MHNGNFVVLADVFVSVIIHMLYLRDYKDGGVKPSALAARVLKVHTALCVREFVHEFFAGDGVVTYKIVSLFMVNVFFALLFNPLVAPVCAFFYDLFKPGKLGTQALYFGVQFFYFLVMPPFLFAAVLSQAFYCAFRISFCPTLLFLLLHRHPFLSAPVLPALHSCLQGA